MKKMIMTILVLAFAGMIAAEEQQQQSFESKESKQAEFTPPFTKAPNFNLLGLDGKRVMLDQYKGKVVIVNFWATHCVPCKTEMPHFSELYTKYKDKGLVIIGISLDRGEDGKAKVKALIEEKKITYPIAFGHPGVIRAYQLGSVIPVSYILDRDHDVYKMYVGLPVNSKGEPDLKKIDTDVEKLLAEKPAEAETTTPSPQKPGQ